MASLLLVAMPFVPSSFLLLVARPGATTSFLAPFVAMRTAAKDSKGGKAGQAADAGSSKCWRQSRCDGLFFLKGE